MTASHRTCYDCGRAFADLTLDVTRDHDDPDRCTDCVARARRRYQPVTVRPDSPDLEIPENA